jgi:hypothetical protein
MRLNVQQWISSSEDAQRRPYPPFPPEGDIEIGMVRYVASTDTFTIYLDCANTYDIAADRILTSAGLLDFIFQVHHKEWCTAQHIMDLLDCVTCYIYRDHNGQYTQMFYGVAGGMNRGLDSP